MATEVNGSTNKEKWVFKYKTTSKNVLSFEFAGQDIFESEGVGLGILKETQGIAKAERNHYSEKTQWSSVDSETILPFGSEPKITRRCEQAANRFRITTDVSVFSKIALESVSIDSLKIKGEWKEIDIYYQKSLESQEIVKKTMLAESLNTKAIIFDYAPLVIVFRNERGIELEIGTGYDLWRWNNSGRFNAKNLFTIEKHKAHILLERKPLIWENEYEISKFNFRYTWYFSWRKPALAGKDKKSLPRKKAETLEIINNKLIPSNNSFSSLANVSLLANWPDSACVSDRTEPCFASRQTEKLLKDFVRSKLANNIKDREKKLTLRDINPQICFKANHLERPKQQIFTHWDYFYIMAFWEWANKYLADFEKTFCVTLKKDSVLAELPSAFGLAGL